MTSNLLNPLFGLNTVIFDGARVNGMVKISDDNF